MDTYSVGAQAVRESKPTAKGAVQAVVVAGEDVGQVRWVVPSTGEKGGARKAVKSDAEQAKEAAARTEALINARTKRAVLEQLRARTKAADKALWQRILHSVLERSYETTKTIIGLGWTEDKKFSKYGGALDACVIEHTKAMTIDQIAGCVNYALCFTKNLDDAKWNEDGRRALLSAAKHLKIDVAAVRTAVTKELKAKKAEPATKVAKESKTKKPAQRPAAKKR